MTEHRLSASPGSVIFVEDRRGWWIELHFDDGMVIQQRRPPFKTYEHAVAQLMEWEHAGVVGRKFGH